MYLSELTIVLSLLPRYSVELGIGKYCQSPLFIPMLLFRRLLKTEKSIKIILHLFGLFCMVVTF